MGWFAMALVDSWEWFPPGHRGRPALSSSLERLASALAPWQDSSSGGWLQVVDQSGRAGNYVETSVTAMVAFALLKALRLGMLPDGGWAGPARRAYLGLCRDRLSVDGSGAVHLDGTCSVAGLGGKPWRDGSYSYYVNEKVKRDDYKGAGPFILASLEYSRSGAGA
jgi:unsaturated rhamnogalacturonyl hydrolase